MKWKSVFYERGGSSTIEIGTEDNPSVIVLHTGALDEANLFSYAKLLVENLNRARATHSKSPQLVALSAAIELVAEHNQTILMLSQQLADKKEIIRRLTT